MVSVASVRCKVLVHPCDDEDNCFLRLKDCIIKGKIFTFILFTVHGIVTDMSIYIVDGVGAKLELYRGFLPREATMTADEIPYNILSPRHVKTKAAWSFIEEVIDYTMMRTVYIFYKI